MEDCIQSLVAAKRTETTPDICSAPMIAKRRAVSRGGVVRQGEAEGGGRCSRCNPAMTGTPLCADDSYASGGGGCSSATNARAREAPGCSDIRDS